MLSKTSPRQIFMFAPVSPRAVWWCCSLIKWPLIFVWTLHICIFLLLQRLCYSCVPPSCSSNLHPLFNPANCHLRGLLCTGYRQYVRVTGCITNYSICIVNLSLSLSKWLYCGIDVRRHSARPAHSDHDSHHCFFGKLLICVACTL